MGFQPSTTGFRLFESLDKTLRAYPGIYDTVRFFLAGLWLDLVRRFVTFVFRIFKQGCVVTARIPDHNEAFDWVSHYISVSLQNAAGAAPSTLPSTSKIIKPEDSRQSAKHQAETMDMPKDYSLRSFILEGIWPTGRSAPRDLSFLVKRQQTSDPFYLEAKRRGLLPSGSASRGGISGGSLRAYGAQEEEDGEGGGLLCGAKLKVTPSHGTAQYIRFEGHTIKVVFQKKNESLAEREEHWIVLSTHFATHKLFTSLIRAAQKQYLSAIDQQTMLYKAEPNSKKWKRSAAKPIRPWNSVILPPGVKEWIYNDAREFLAEQHFYNQRGLPHRRGYLFYGVPGSGKSSLISALAAKLKLDIYVINLGSPTLNDDSLAELLTSCPDGCILLMEDIATSYSDLSLLLSQLAQLPAPQAAKGAQSQQAADANKTHGVTLSGLLNALDGVASSEGRLLFCTTNWRSEIDPALSRPGRCDVWIEFRNATRSQAHDLFIYFYDREHDRPTKKVDDRTIAAQEMGGPNDGKTSERLSEKPKAAPQQPNEDFKSTITQFDGSSSTKKTFSAEEIEKFAQAFASLIPVDKISVSALTGYLVKYKRRPDLAAADVEEWIRGGCAQDPTTAMMRGLGLGREPGGTSSEEGLRMSPFRIKKKKKAETHLHTT
ncbi:hypothetical protein I316_02301 [Kwoniella heveanensis BCC8398]|uniref:AAA+ ATPase domain-containing protein n=1 Tax=Kwoniella heveanensis BCC8398 TaxID=1296120 RepID=A0A1B9GXP7_9TREE|nr:hypothetical protein I316_02301 [Kwoniella heveanensis BCC8398]